MRIKKGVSLILMAMLLVMQFSFIGCGNSANGGKIVFVMQRLNNDYFNNISKAFESVLTKQGYSYEATADEEWGADLQAEVIRKVIKEKPKAIILAPVVGDELYEAIGEANKAGIPIILIDSDLDRELLEVARVHVETFVGINNYEGGKLVADKVAESLEKGSKVAIVGGGVTAPSGEERCTGFQEEITKKGMEVVGRFTTNWSDVEGYERGKVFLTAHPDIKAVFAANSGILKGIMKAADEMNLSIYGSTFERDDITDEFMEKGILLCTYDQNIEGLAETVGEVVKKIANGEKLEPVTVSEGKLLSK